jgi:hypothetical protein
MATTMTMTMTMERTTEQTAFAVRLSVFEFARRTCTQRTRNAQPTQRIVSAEQTAQCRAVRRKECGWVVRCVSRTELAGSGALVLIARIAAATTTAAHRRAAVARGTVITAAAAASVRGAASVRTAVSAAAAAAAAAAAVRAVTVRRAPAAAAAATTTAAVRTVTIAAFTIGHTRARQRPKRSVRSAEQLSRGGHCAYHIGHILHRAVRPTAPARAAQRRPRDGSDTNRRTCSGPSARTHNTRRCRGHHRHRCHHR